MKKNKKSDMRSARIHFQNAVKEILVGSAYMLKGIREMSVNKNYRKQILENAGDLIDQGLDLLIKFAEALDEYDVSSKKSSEKKKKRSRKIEIG